MGKSIAHYCFVKRVLMRVTGSLLPVAVVHHTGGRAKGSVTESAGGRGLSHV